MTPDFNKIVGKNKRLTDGRGNMKNTTKTDSISFAELITRFGPLAYLQPAVC